MRADALLFHDEFRIAPYWWDAAPPETSRVALPPSVDLVIVGSGYCGLSAAVEAARQGASVAVLDAAEIGAGGSTRSGGMVSSGQKLALTDAIRGVSAERLGRLMAESSGEFRLSQAPDSQRIARRRSADKRPLFWCVHPRAFRAAAPSR
jgi:gamma-glutamylputrescine oxidase